VTVYIGIDVQIARAPCFAALSEAGDLVDSGWAAEATVASVVALRPRWLALADRVVVAIDSPRVPVSQPREWYWRAGAWRARSDQAGAGRHCEVVLKALGLANPQWAQPRDRAEDWMLLGFDLFEALAELAPLEVFPAASFAQFHNTDAPSIRVSLDQFAPGPRDMLDACIAAVTAREFDLGHGCEVGGGDGLGTIVLPRPCAHPVLRQVGIWPQPSGAG